MAQFDVYKNPRGGAYPLLLDVQAELLARLATRVVVPMMTRKRYGAKPITRLNPIAHVRGASTCSCSRSWPRSLRPRSVTWSSRSCRAARISWRRSI
jgi:hypothetical protein